MKGLKTDHANHVWGIDITYVPMKKGFMYLCAIIDLHNRYVVNWSISNTMTAQCCCELVEVAIRLNGKLKIINTDQGSQFTSLEFTQLLKDNAVLFSMDGKSRALDNIFIERLWNVSNTNVFTCMLLRTEFSFTKDLPNTIHFITPSAYTRL